MLEKQVDVCVGRDRNGERLRLWSGKVAAKEEVEVEVEMEEDEKEEEGNAVLEWIQNAKPTPPPGV